MFKKITSRFHLTNKSKAFDLLNELGQGMMDGMAANPFLATMGGNTILFDLKKIDMALRGEKSPDSNDLRNAMKFDVAAKGNPIIHALLETNAFNKDQIEHIANESACEDHSKIEILNKYITKRHAPKLQR